MEPLTSHATTTRPASAADTRVEQPSPSPALFMETVGAYQRTAAIKAAIELDLFTAIAEGSQTAAAIAERCEASPRGVRILADFLVVTGFLVKEDGRYALTHDSFVFLNRRSPAFVGSAIEFLLHPVNVDSFKHLADVVRRGTAETNHLTPDNEVWILFARAMAPMMAMPAQMVADALGVRQAGPMRVLDVAAGHGLYGIAVAQQNPRAQVVALDWESVLRVARENAAAADVSNRHETISGDALAVDLGRDYDLVLVPNFLHHFDRATCVAFLRRAHDALAVGGRIAILEFVPEVNRVEPPPAASFPMMMLALTPSGDAYTLDEHRQMLEEAGFHGVSMEPIPPMEQLISALR